jgi:MHS family proline/betaine transporter-like MFS transporter
MRQDLRAQHRRRIEPAHDLSHSRRALIATCIGNFVEWYDFAVYGAFATVIARTFFPTADRAAGLLGAFAVFAGAFLFRPLGAVLFGRHGDRSGRRGVLATVIILMSLATAGIGLLPGTASIGLLAPVLLVVLRCAQGLSVGGEAASASAFAIEHAPAGRRGTYGAWLWATVGLGLAAGIGVATLLAGLLPRAALQTWGWRVAFLLALPLGLVGLYLRLRLDETPHFRAVEDARALARRPLVEALRAGPARALVGFGLVAAASLSFNTFFVFLPNHLATTQRLPLSRALAAALGGLAVMVAASPALGRLSDRVGRRALLAAGMLSLVAGTVPAYLLIRQATPAGLALGYLLVGAAIACFVLPSFLSELFPTRVRSTALSLTYGMAGALLGGTAPLVDSLLVRHTGNPLSPAWCAVAVTAVAATGLLLTRETAFQPLDGEHVKEGNLITNR